MVQELSLLAFFIQVSSQDCPPSAALPGKRKIVNFYTKVWSSLEKLVYITTQYFVRSGPLSF
jgi:hypothetical protein